MPPEIHAILVCRPAESKTRRSAIGTIYRKGPGWWTASRQRDQTGDGEEGGKHGGTVYRLSDALDRSLGAIPTGVQAKSIEVIELSNHVYPLQRPFGALRV